MKFQYLEDVHKEWCDILVIGKTIERDGRRYHIVGMTMDEMAKLYIIEPYSEPEHQENRKRGVRNQRKLMKEHREGLTGRDSYLHCKEFCLGDQPLQVQGSSGTPLRYSAENYVEIELFFDMFRAGWIVPDWLKDEEWDNLHLVTLDIADAKALPQYSSGMSITIRHSSCYTECIVEKAITLNVGKSRSFCFADHYGDEVQCYINDVTLIDVWKSAEEQFRDPRLTERFSEEEIQKMKEQYQEMLQQKCPRGMCYFGIEYECSKDFSLQFYSREYLSSVPEVHEGKAVFSVMSLKPDKKTGPHGLPLKGCAIQTPVSPDTAKMPAELFLYLEKIPEWEETV